MPEENILQLGAVAILFLIFIREFFAYMKSKKAFNSDNGIKNVVSELKLINENHLRSIEKTIRDGDDKVVGAINDGNQKIIEILGRIDGRLDK